MAERYEVVKVNNLMGGAPAEYDVWGNDENHEGPFRRLIASYAFEHQAKEVAAVLNKWAAAEI